MTFKGPTHEKNMKACFEQLLRPSKKHESLLPKSDFDAEYVICSNTCKQENHIKCKLKSDVHLEAYKQTRKSNIMHESDVRLGAHRRDDVKNQKHEKHV
jgi:hypothetical protein